MKLRHVDINSQSQHKLISDTQYASVVGLYLAARGVVKCLKHNGTYCPIVLPLSPYLSVTEATSGYLFPHFIAPLTARYCAHYRYIHRYISLQDKERIGRSSLN